MAIDLEAIEQICNDIWGLTTQLRELAITARRSEGLSLSGEQKKLLKNEFLRIKDELEAKVKELPKKVG